MSRRAQQPRSSFYPGHRLGEDEDPNPRPSTPTPNWNSTSRLVKCCMLCMLLLIALCFTAFASTYWLTGMMGTRPVRMGLFKSCLYDGCGTMDEGVVKMNWMIFPTQLSSTLGLFGFVAVALYAGYVFSQYEVDSLEHCDRLKPIWRWLLVASVVHILGVGWFFFVTLATESSCGIDDRAVLHYGWSFYVALAADILGAFTYYLLRVKYKQENYVGMVYQVRDNNG